MANLETELHLARYFADNIREGNVADQRLYLLRHIDRALAALPKAEPVANTLGLRICPQRVAICAIGCAGECELVLAPPAVKALTALQGQALTAWADTDTDFDVLSFGTIAKRSGLPHKQVRRVVRDMARKGVTEYHRGCWTIDGDPAGSGYGLTATGRVLLRKGDER